MLDLAGVVAEVATEVLGRATSVTAATQEGPSPGPNHIDVTPLAALGLRPSATLRAAVHETLLACLDRPAR